MIGQLGALPRLLVWDNEGGVGRYGGADPKLTTQFSALRGMLGTRFYVCRPRDPETKGLTERNNGFFETSSLHRAPVRRPGRFQHAAGRVPGPGERA